MPNQARRQEAQHVSLEHFRVLAEHSLVGIYTIQDGVFTYVNPALAAIFGYRPEELVGKLGLVDLAHPEDRELVAAVVQLHVEGVEETAHYAFQGLRKDGTLIYCEARDRRSDYLGRPAIIGTLADITERRQAELAERESRTLAEALRDTIAALTSTLDPELVMRRILENVGRVVPHEGANILLIEGDMARLAYLYGYPAAQQEALSALRFPLDVPTLRHMLSTGRPCLVSDTAAHPDWTSAAGGGEVRSYIGAPIKAHGQVIGFLNLNSTRAGFFTPAHLERLQAFADQVAIAVENAQIYDTLNSYALEMTTLYRATAFLFANLSTAQGLPKVGRQIVEAIVEALGQVACGVMLVAPDGKELVRLARSDGLEVQAPLYVDGPGLVPEAVRTGQMVYAPDVRQDPRYVPNVPQTRSELVIPLVTGKGVIGALDLQSPELDAFNEQDRRAIRAFADWAATAIENIQLYEEVRQQADELERRVAERTMESRRVKEHVEAILNNSSDAIIVSYRDGTIRQTNPTFDELFGYAPDEVFGHSLSEIVEGRYAPTLMSVLEAVVTGRQRQRIEVLARRKDGSTFSADVALSPLVDTAYSGRDSLSIVCSLRDITERKRAEEELRRALEQERELSELKSRFVSMASHEFRTPLTTIISSADLLEHHIDRMDPARKAKHFSKIQDAARYMTQLLEDILLVGKVEAEKLEFNPTRLDLQALCQDVVEEMQLIAGPERPIRFSYQGRCREVVMDERLLRYILNNLLSNAIKYSPEGGQVGFDVRCEGNETVIRVTDQGIGIPEQEQARIFEPFHRARNVGTIKGTGLGLAIAKKSAELHGGTISFDSRVGAGTTFTVVIPTVAPLEGANDQGSGDRGRDTGAGEYHRNPGAGGV